MHFRVLSKPTVRRLLRWVTYRFFNLCKGVIFHWKILFLWNVKRSIALHYTQLSNTHRKNDENFYWQISKGCNTYSNEQFFSDEKYVYCQRERACQFSLRAWGKKLYSLIKSFVVREWKPSLKIWEKKESI